MTAERKMWKSKRFGISKIRFFGNCFKIYLDEHYLTDILEMAIENVSNKKIYYY